MIALIGLDAETGVFMLLFLDLAYQEAGTERLACAGQGLADAIVEGAAKRMRPKLMTVATAFLGLLRYARRWHRIGCREANRCSNDRRPRLFLCSGIACLPPALPSVETANEFRSTGAPSTALSLKTEERS